LDPPGIDNPRLLFIRDTMVCAIMPKHMSSRLLGIRIKNFKSFADLSLGQVHYGSGESLPRFACFIGPNGSGKSSLLDAFGFVADCLLEGAEAASDKPHRGGFDRLRAQGVEEPISFEIFFEDEDSQRPIVYEIEIDLADGVPVVTKEYLRQRRKGETRGKPYYFLKLDRGRGKAWAGDALGVKDDNKNSAPIELADLNRLGITTLGNLKEHPRIVRLRSYIEQWYLSYFIPDAARHQPPAGPQRWLDAKGANIANVLQYFQRAHGEQFESIKRRIKEGIPGLQDLAIEQSLDKRLLLKFSEAGYSDPFYQQSMSDGTLKMLAYAVLLADPAPRPFIGIEEPENGLYIKLIEHLARQFLDHTRSESAPTQVFVTTHSPYFVDALEPHQVWLMSKNAQGKGTATRVADFDNVVALKNAGVPLGAQWYSEHFGHDPTGSLKHTAPTAAKKAKGRTQKRTEQR
jgi:predicted ATPase